MQSRPPGFYWKKLSSESTLENKQPWFHRMGNCMRGVVGGVGVGG